MCGITGIAGIGSRGPSQGGVIASMCDVMQHRGPDESGYYLNDGVSLGMRRLKVIDLSTGTQPIFNEDRTVVTVFNGEIYNFRRLRETLSRSGHIFQTETDTEVIVHLYEEYGDEFARHLNGMFAIALWDEPQKKLVLARDRLGEKPLHYSVTDGGIIFASEIKSILVSGLVQKELDYEAMYHYFSLICVPAPMTIFKGIHKLPPGCYLIYRDGAVVTRRYWELSYEPDHGRSEDDFCRELRELSLRSLRDRMISDVPLGAFLSGGIDSTIVVGLMSGISGRRVKTFSIGFREEEFNELKYARIVAERFGTEHHELVVEPKAIDLVEKLVWHFDEPFGGPSAIPTFLVSELARRHVTVVVTGDGGDEVFGGYDSYAERMKRRKLGIIPAWLRRALSRGVGMRLPDNARGKVFLQSLGMDEARLHYVGLSETWKRRIFSEDALRRIGGLDSFQSAQGHLGGAHMEYLSRFMYLDTLTYLPDNVLVKVDRMSMANSLETRTLFLDHEIVELAARIPSRFKIRGGIRKYILKRSMADLIPPEIMNRKKSGFALPVSAWFRGELKDLISSVVEGSRRSGIFNYDFLKARLDEHLAGRKNNKRLLWALMMFHLWHERHMRA
jgi:asparagine synthase (glutamine-hydrolysing)